MPTFEITSPDGKKYRVTAPDGATQEQVLSYAQSQYKTSKQEPAQPKEQQINSAMLGPTGAYTGIGEAALNMGSGMIAKPLSDVFGLAATAKDWATGNKNGDAAGFKRSIQDALTYQPRTEMGRVTAEYNPLALLGKVISATGRGVNAVVAPEGSGPVQTAMGNALEEATNQAPNFLGLKAAPAASEAMRGSAQNWMRSALKPPLESQKGGTNSSATRAVNTLLDEGVNVSQGGVRKLRAGVDDLNTQITTAIANSPATVNKAQVGKRMVGLMDDFKKQVSPSADLAAIQGVWGDFMNHPSLGRDIPVGVAQEMKQGTYRALNDKSFGELKGAQIEAQKTLARGLKEEIAAAVPEVGPLNAKESSLLNALSLTERRALVEANKNPMGLSLLTANPANWAAFMADRSGLFKSLVARMINQASATTGSIGPFSGLGAGAYAAQGGLLNYPEAQGGLLNKPQ